MFEPTNEQRKEASSSSHPTSKEPPVNSPQPSTESQKPQPEKSVTREMRAAIIGQVFRGASFESLRQQFEEKSIRFAILEVVFAQANQRIFDRHYRDGKFLEATIPSRTTKNEQKRIATFRDLCLPNGDPDFWAIQLYLREVFQEEAVGFMEELQKSHPNVIDVLKASSGEAELPNLVEAVGLGMEIVTAAGATIYFGVKPMGRTTFLENSLPSLYLLASQNHATKGDPYLYLESLDVLHTEGQLGTQVQAYFGGMNNEELGAFLGEVEKNFISSQQFSPSSELTRIQSLRASLRDQGETQRTAVIRYLTGEDQTSQFWNVRQHFPQEIPENVQRELDLSLQERILPRKLSPRFFEIDEEQEKIILRVSQEEKTIDDQIYPPGTPLIWLTENYKGLRYMDLTTDDPTMRCVGMTAVIPTEGENKTVYPFRGARVNSISLSAAIIAEIFATQPSATPLSEVHESEKKAPRKHSPSPLETVFAYTPDYDHATALEPENHEQLNIPEESTLTRDIIETFSQLLTTDEATKRQALLDKLKKLHDQSLAISRVAQATESAETDQDDWFSFQPSPLVVEGSNFIYADTVIELINDEVQKIKSSYQGQVLAHKLIQFYEKLKDLPFFSRIDPEQKVEEAITLDVDPVLQDVLGLFENMNYFATGESEEEFQQAKLRLARLISEIRNRLSLDPAQDQNGETKLQEFNRKLVIAIQKKAYPANYLEHKGRELREAREKEEVLLRERGIDDLLVSTPEYVVMIHRTSPELAEKILQTGLPTFGEIKTTASPTGSDKSRALFEYFREHKQNSAVIILRVPRRLYTTIDDPDVLPTEKYQQGDHEKTTPVVPPSWIVGYVDRGSAVYHANQHLGEVTYDQNKPPISFTSS